MFCLKSLNTELCPQVSSKKVGTFNHWFLISYLFLCDTAFLWLDYWLLIMCCCSGWIEEKLRNGSGNLLHGQHGMEFNFVCVEYMFFSCILVCLVWFFSVGYGHKSLRWCFQRSIDGRNLLNLGASRMSVIEVGIWIRVKNGFFIFLFPSGFSDVLDCFRIWVLVFWRRERGMVSGGEAKGIQLDFAFPPFSWRVFWEVWIYEKD